MIFYTFNAKHVVPCDVSSIDRIDKAMMIFTDYYIELISESVPENDCYFLRD